MAKKIKVLLVDDEKEFLDSLSERFELRGFEVYTAQSGPEALQLAQKTKIHAAVVDLKMPDMDGLSALKQIMTHDPDARVAMVSAMGQKSMVVEALEVGAKDFVVKPFDAARVLQAVQKLVS